MGRSRYKRSYLEMGKDGAGQDIIAHGATPGAYLKWDKATDTLYLVNAALDIVGDVEIEGDVTLTTEDISLVQGRKLYLAGQDSTEYISSENAGYVDIGALTGIRLGAAVDIALATGTGVHSAITPVAAYTGWALGFYGQAIISNTSGNAANAAGGVFEVNVAAAHTGGKSGIWAGIYVGAFASSTTVGSLPTAGIVIENIAGATVDMSTVPLMTFMTSGGGGGGGAMSQILFEIGNAEAAKTVGTLTTEMFYHQTLKCIVNAADLFIPMSTVEGTYTTAYPISSTSTLSGTYASSTSGESALKFTDTYSITDGYHVGAWFTSTGSAADASTASVYALRGHAATSGVKTNTATAHYIIGAQGRIALGGTVNADNLIAAGVLGQVLDAGTLTKVSNIAAVWADSQLATTVSSGDFSLFYGSVNGDTRPGQMISLYGDADYFLKTAGKEQAGGWYQTTQTTSGAERGYLKVVISGNVRRIKLFNNTD